MPEIQGIIQQPYPFTMLITWLFLITKQFTNLIRIPIQKVFRTSIDSLNFSCFTCLISAKYTQGAAHEKEGEKKD